MNWDFIGVQEVYTQAFQINYCVSVCIIVGRTRALVLGKGFNDGYRAIFT